MDRQIAAFQKNIPDACSQTGSGQSLGTLRHLETERADLVMQIAGARAELSALRRFAKRGDPQIARLRARSLGQQARLRAADNLIAAEKEKLSRLPDMERNLNAMLRESDAIGRLYTLLIDQEQRLNLESCRTMAPTTLISAASPPQSPCGRRRQPMRRNANGPRNGCEERCIYKSGWPRPSFY